MRKLIISILAFIIIFSLSVYAEDNFSSDISVYYSDDVYSVDFEYQLPGGIKATNVILNITDCIFEWNYVEADNTLYISIASASPLETKINILTLITDGECKPIFKKAIVNGNISTKSYLPGDINGDGIVNTKDITTLRRYNVGGYNLTVIEDAVDVNKDGTVNTKDITTLRRYNAGGYNITIE